MSTSIISVHNLRKQYENHTAVKGISFTVEPGEIFGILGPNGAGKTTTLEMIEGLTPFSAGEVILDGMSIVTHPKMIKKIIGVQLQSSAYFDLMTLTELIEFFSCMYGKKIDAYALLELVQLTDKADQEASELSGGQLQRLSIALALVNDPKIIFLDEPTTGLDPQARRNLWDLIRSIRDQGKTIILTTHYMDEAEQLCDRIAIMDAGSIIALDTPQGLIRLIKKESAVQFSFPEEYNTSAHLDAFEQFSEVSTVSLRRNTVAITTADAAQTIINVMQYAKQKAITFNDIQIRLPNLEDVFLNLTGKALRD